MLNIVVVSDFAHVEGGSTAVALSSAIGLAGRGHRVTLLVAVSPIEPTLLDSGLRVICTQQHAIGDDPQRIRALIQGIWNRLHVDGGRFKDLILVIRWFTSTGGARLFHLVSSEPPCLVSSRSYAPFTITFRLVQMGVFSIIQAIRSVSFDRCPVHVSQASVIDGIMAISFGVSHDNLCKTVSEVCRGRSATSLSCLNSAAGF